MKINLFLGHRLLFFLYFVVTIPNSLSIEIDRDSMEKIL